MKFTRSSAKWLDTEYGSGILVRVTFNTLDQYGPKKGHRKNNIPYPNLMLLDCSRRVEIHEFGETRKAALKKLRVMQDELAKFEQYISCAWDKYDAFWENRDED